MRAGIDTTVLLIYDSEGNLVAESKGAAQSVFGKEDGALSVRTGPSSAVDYAAAFGEGSELTRWLTNQIDQARKLESHRAQSRFDHRGKHLSIRFETVRFPGLGNRYAVLISSSEDSIPDGSSVITRQQWHDIKNHLGGLKLYATFLKKKLDSSEDQAIVEKLLNGINGLIDHLAQIRGGEAK
jgi:hypothetical protein